MKLSAVSLLAVLGGANAYYYGDVFMAATKDSNNFGVDRYNHHVMRLEQAHDRGQALREEVLQGQGLAASDAPDARHRRHAWACQVLVNVANAERQWVAYYCAVWAGSDGRWYMGDCQKEPHEDLEHCPNVPPIS